MLYAGFDTKDMLMVALAILALLGTSKLTPLLVGFACPWEALRQKREEFKRRLEAEMRPGRDDAMDRLALRDRRRRRWALGALLAVLVLAALLLSAGSLPDGGPFLLGRQ